MTGTLLAKTVKKAVALEHPKQHEALTQSQKTRFVEAQEHEQSGTHPPHQTKT